MRELGDAAADQGSDMREVIRKLPDGQKIADEQWHAAVGPPEPRQVQIAKRRMVPRAFAEWHLPDVLPGVEIDGSDTTIGWLPERQSVRKA